VAALVFAGLIGARLLRTDPAKARAAALRQEREALLRQVRAGRDVWQNAVRVLQLETALATGGDASCVDAEAVRRAKPVDEATAAEIDEIFEARNALVFAGGTTPAMTTDRLERLVKTLEAFCRG
jgi:hypothetical protein